MSRPVLTKELDVIVLNALSKEDFLATMADPMRFIDDKDEDCPAVPIGDYFRECIRSENIATDPESVEIHAVFAAPNHDYCHILLNWGARNVFLVIITRPHQQEVYGHYVLDLNDEYGLYDTRNGK